MIHVVLGLVKQKLTACKSSHGELCMFQYNCESSCSVLTELSRWTSQLQLPRKSCISLWDHVFIYRQCRTLAAALKKCIHINSLVDSSLYSVLNLSIHIYLSLLHTYSADKGSCWNSLTKLLQLYLRHLLAFFVRQGLLPLTLFVNISKKHCVIGFSSTRMWVVLLCRNEWCTIKIHIVVSWVKAWLILKVQLFTLPCVSSMYDFLSSMEHKP